ncbi:MAG TPA: hypothetical protein VHE30_27080 [Polyangiaceae bacterium]|nr:hypothetical protein [Polyangiaceae bacterium]
MTRAATATAAATRTLRHVLDQKRAQGRPLSLKETVGIIVPLAVEVAQRHAHGETLFLTPGCLVQDLDGAYQIADELAKSAPQNPRDKACLAPECRGGKPGDARASVFSVGAMLYELCTGESVGPAMRRPADVVPTLPPSLEMILARALVVDAAHRPDDLKALAQAIHHLSPTGSIPPPAADESHLDHDENFEVDVSMSMLPQIPRGGQSPYDVSVREAAPAPSGVDQATHALTDLKQRLESDPRPRYVVIRDGMDHGPFSAVELLQQIASHTFTEKDLLRDTFSNDERLLTAWEEFAPFAEHARRHRDIAAEKVAIEKTVESEKKSTRGKALVGMTAIGVLLVAGGAWFLVKAGTRKDDVAVQSETVTNVEGEGNLNVPKSKGGKGGGRRVVGEQGGVPILAGGMSCEAAQAAYVEEINIGGSKVPADITASQYGALLNSGSYLNGCGLPSSTAVDVCVAVQNGRAVGVTVRTRPSNPGAASCISGHLRGMSFPAHPKLDVTRTSFAAQ